MNRKQIEEEYQHWLQSPPVMKCAIDFYLSLTKAAEKDVLSRCKQYIESRGYDVLAKDLVREMGK